MRAPCWSGASRGSSFPDGFRLFLSLALIAAAAAPVGAAAAAPGAPPGFISRVVAYRPGTIDCRAALTLHPPLSATIHLHIRGRLPLPVRTDVTAVAPEGGPLTRMVGMVLVVDADQVQTYDPTTRQVRTERVSGRAAGRPGAAGVGFTLADLLLIDDAANFDLLGVSPQEVEGRSLVRYDFALRAPRLVGEVLVARQSIWVDPRTGEPVRVQLYDAARRPVGIVALKEPRPLPGGGVLPMLVEAFLGPPDAPTTIVRVAYTLKDGRFFLPVTVDAFEGTTAVFSVHYRDCRVNQPLEPGLFRL